MMAIDEFREWVEDPLRDDFVRWELMYRATVNYCQQHQQLPPQGYTTSFEGYDDLKLGNWMKAQKKRHEGTGKMSSLTDEQLNKLMAIDEFRQWAEDPLRDNDVRWELMYRSLVDYCQEHQRLPAAYDIISFEGHDDLNLGMWVNVQKERYNGRRGQSSLTDEKLNKLMTIVEFREWAEDPLRGADVRWEFMYRATVDYCQHHQKLPPPSYTTSFEGCDDLKIGVWVETQKKCHEGTSKRSFLSDDQRNKMMAIEEFREWVEDPLRDDFARWELMYRATIDYCQQHQQLPPKRWTTSFEGHDDLKLGKWISTQKKQCDGQDGRYSLTDEQRNKLMAINEFREWADGPLRDDFARWELMHRATVDYCQQHQRLPPDLYQTSFEGYDHLHLGSWVETQKDRYDGKGKTSLTDDKLSKLMAIDEFREWAEDPLRGADVRWELMYRATVDYCQQHQQLPPKRWTTSFEGHGDLKLGKWVSTQRQRYQGLEGYPALNKERQVKLMAIDEFRQWAEDPLRGADVR